MRAASFYLIERQSPRQARMCGCGDKVDRRPLDPPPIVELELDHGNDDEQVLSDVETEGGHGLRNENFILTATLMHSTPSKHISYLGDQAMRLTLGTMVSSAFTIQNPEEPSPFNRDGGAVAHGSCQSCFFYFPDISIRVEGHYCLKYTLFECLDGGSKLRKRTTLLGAPFEVFTAKRFPGLRGSTKLSIFMAERGLKIRLRSERKWDARKMLSWRQTKESKRTAVRDRDGGRDTRGNEPRRGSLSNLRLPDDWNRQPQETERFFPSPGHELHQPHETMKRHPDICSVISECQRDRLPSPPRHMEAMSGVRHIRRYSALTGQSPHESPDSANCGQVALQTQQYESSNSLGHIAGLFVTEETDDPSRLIYESDRGVLVQPRTSAEGGRPALRQNSGRPFNPRRTLAGPRTAKASARACADSGRRIMSIQSLLN